MFANSKKVTTFAPAIEREILDKKDGPFVYRLGRKIFILERGVRFPHGLPKVTSYMGSDFFYCLFQRGSCVEIYSLLCFQIFLFFVILHKHTKLTNITERKDGRLFRNSRKG